MNTQPARVARPGLRRFTAVTGAVALAATALVAGASEAAAASQSITGASFTRAGGSLPGNYLGWTPIATAPLITPGGVVASGYGTPMGNGLSQPAALATVDGGDPGAGDAGANLEMKAPVDAEPGSYQATLTLTGLT